MESSSHPRVPEHDKRYLIAEVEVVDLFGKYQYRITPLSPSEARFGAPPLMLLYGSNGSGKTTVLRILWDLLSPADDQGHRGRLATTPFRRIAVRLGNGDRIDLEKQNALVGSYFISVTRGKRRIVRQFYMFNERRGSVTAAFSPEQLRDDPEARRTLERLGIDPTAPDEFFQSNVAEIVLGKASDRFSEYLRKLDSRPIYLADDRRIHADSVLLSARDRYQQKKHERSETSSPITEELAVAIARTNDWLRQQLFSGAAAGSRNVDEVYRDVLTHVAQVDDPVETVDIDDLRSRLQEIGDRTTRFSEFGLVPRLNARPLIRVLDKANPSRYGLISSILDPYLDGQAVRLDSLQETESLVRSFVNNLNEYLGDKTLHFSPRRGLEIKVEDDRVLDPTRLSSGERQLLLLHCNALLARESASLFLIDEPEISLNAKWQRRLVQTLRDCVGSSGVQFILATHSIEIISKHRQFLTQLSQKSVVAQDASR